MAQRTTTRDRATISSTADFAIEIDFQRNTESPARVFRAMTGLIETFEQLDHTLARSLDVDLKPVLLLEDIETGSLRAWLRSEVSQLPDEALDKFDWKRIVGTYLVRSKRAILNWTERKTTITDRTEIVDLQKQLATLAEETHVNHMEAYAPPDMREILDGVQRVSTALNHLRSGDTAKFESSQGDAIFNLEFYVAPEALENLITAQTIVNRGEQLLKVKKPDYLGESQWQLRHGTRTSDMTIEDAEWLREFQARKVNVRPGDALLATLRIELHYGFDGELVGEHYYVEEVKEVIEPRGGETLPLLPV
jgi:hypothetical protein